MKRIAGIVLTAVLVAAALAMLAEQGSVKVKELSPYAQVGVKGSVSLVADCEAARMRGANKYIPIRVYLGLQGKGKIYAERTSFTLADPQGNKHAMASVQEIAKDYGDNYVSMDYDYYRLNSTFNYGSHFNGCQPMGQVAFFPNPAGPRVLADQIELPPYSYFSALMYFPNPAGEAVGNYILTWNDPKGGNAIDVPFTIKWEKEKPKK